MRFTLIKKIISLKVYSVKNTIDTDKTKLHIINNKRNQKYVQYLLSNKT